MSKFFQSNEFKLLKKIEARVSMLNTRGNYLKYVNQVGICRGIARTDFSNVGWREDLGVYAWESRNKFGPEVELMDGLEWDMGQKIYMSKDMRNWVVKMPDETLIQYTENDTEKLRDSSIRELRRINKIRYEFEGELIDAEEGNEASRPVQRKAK